MGSGGHGRGGAFQKPYATSINSTNTTTTTSSHQHGHGHGPPPPQKSGISHWGVFLKTVPYVWPKDNIWLRIEFILSLIFAAASSVGDLVTPIATKYAVDDLSGDNPQIPVKAIILYGILRFSGTFFSQLRDICFAGVSAHTERLVALETFQHLQSLSLSFHLRRETGAILRSVSRGASSFGTLLRIVLFSILPVFFQVAVVCGYLFYNYPYYFGLLTGAIIILYFVFTFTTTDWRDKYRRIMNEKDNEFNQKAVDALLNFETVKYFNAEEHEEKRYGKALSEYAQANIRSQQTLAVLNSGQNVIISVGLAVAMYLSARQVANGDMTVGDFVMVQGFILQLYQPLGFLGTYYRMIKQNIVDVESMFELLKEPRDLTDKPNAPQLKCTAAEIKFENVCFAYDKANPILRGISFTVKPGQRLAIVGSTGAGKSTIARLLYRFYDVQSGRITIDGQDISLVTQKSLRSNIAIVPQDCVLFNDSIGYNIGYGSPQQNATQQQIEQAAEAASIHSFIQTQPLKYDTKVGERGLRLSGGEKQRVAIARALLKHPKIMLFDEATSSLDSQTEAAIQEQLERVAEGHTTITIAHRLSTIMNYDIILVLDKGIIGEIGSHNELLQLNGLYRKMWDRQIRTAQLQAELDEIQSAKQSQIEQSPPNNIEEIKDNNVEFDSSSETIGISVVSSNLNEANNNNNNNDDDEESTMKPKKKNKSKNKTKQKDENDLKQPLLNPSDDKV